MSETFIIATRLRLKKKAVTQWLRSPFPDADFLEGYQNPFLGAWKRKSGFDLAKTKPKTVRHAFAQTADEIAADESGQLICAWSGSSRSLLFYHVMIGWQPEIVLQSLLALGTASEHWTLKRPAQVLLFAETSGRLNPDGLLAVLEIDSSGARFVSKASKAAFNDLSPAEDLWLRSLEIGTVDAMHEAELLQPQIRQLAKSPALKKRKLHVPVFESAEDWLAAIARIRLLDESEPCNDPISYKSYAQFEPHIMQWAGQVLRFGVSIAPRLGALLKQHAYAPGVIAYWALNQLSIETREPFFYLWALELWRDWGFRNQGWARGEVTDDLTAASEHMTALVDTPFANMENTDLRNHGMIFPESCLDANSGIVDELREFALKSDHLSVATLIGKQGLESDADRSLLSWVWLHICNALHPGEAGEWADGLFEGEIKTFGDEVISNACFDIGRALISGEFGIPPDAVKGLGWIKEARAMGYVEATPPTAHLAHEGAVNALLKGETQAFLDALKSKKATLGVLKALVPVLRCEDNQAHVFASNPEVHKAFMEGVDSFLSLKRIPLDGLGLLAQALCISVAVPTDDPRLMEIIEELRKRGGLANWNSVWFLDGRSSLEHQLPAARMCALAALNPGGIQTQAADMACRLFANLKEARACVAAANSGLDGQGDHLKPILLNCYFVFSASLGQFDGNFERHLESAVKASKMSGNEWLIINLLGTAYNSRNLEMGRRIIQARISGVWEDGVLSDSAELPEKALLNAALIEVCPGGDDAAAEKWCRAAVDIGDQGGNLLLGCLRAREGRTSEAIKFVQQAQNAGYSMKDWKGDWVVEPLEAIPDLAPLFD